MIREVVDQCRLVQEMRMETAVNQWKKRAAMSRLKVILPFERKYLNQQSSQVPPLNAGHNNATEEDELYNSLESKRRESSG